MAKPILDAYGVKDVAVVTNKFHVDRSRLFVKLKLRDVLFRRCDY